WENGAHHAFLQFFGMNVGDIPEGPTTPDLEWPTWMVYCAIPFGSSLMSFRFLQVAWVFLKTGELPHHDHAHVEGVEDEAPLIGEALIEGEENMHVHLGQGDKEWAKSHPRDGGTKP
uniref:TRAP transporter small permease n=1 Tax=Rhodoferax sp. TaxID=50421 RepID=UPI00374DE794